MSAYKEGKEDLQAGGGEQEHKIRITITSKVILEK